MCARLTRLLIVLPAVWIAASSDSSSWSSGLARATSHMYRVSVMPVCSHTSGNSGTRIRVAPGWAEGGAIVAAIRTASAERVVCGGVRSTSVGERMAETNIFAG